MSSSVGYIAVVHYHYDSTEQVSDPSVVHSTREAAQAEADEAAQGSSSTTGYVWEVKLP